MVTLMCASSTPCITLTLGLRYVCVGESGVGGGGGGGKRDEDEVGGSGARSKTVQCNT